MSLCLSAQIQPDCCISRKAPGLAAAASNITVTTAQHCQDKEQQEQPLHYRMVQPSSAALAQQ